MCPCSPLLLEPFEPALLSVQISGHPFCPAHARLEGPREWAKLGGFSDRVRFWEQDEASVDIKAKGALLHGTPLR